MRELNFSIVRILTSLHNISAIKPAVVALTVPPNRAIDDWCVCWIGSWEKWQLVFMVKVERRITACLARPGRV